VSKYYWSTQNPEPMISSSTAYSIPSQSRFLLVDATLGSMHLKLPPAALNAGQSIFLQRLDTSNSSSVSIYPSSGEDLGSENSTLTSAALTLQNPILHFTSTTTSSTPPTYYWKFDSIINYRGDLGYNSGYYTTLNTACVGSGPIASLDPTISSQYVGGVYIDLDRSALGPREDLLLNLTFFPLDQSNQKMNLSSLSVSEAGSLRVHLVRTGHSADVVRSINQPRILTYGATDQYPRSVDTLAILAPPTGQIQQAQVLIPLSIDPAIDRIHIQRISGSIIFIDATLYRMGYR
ncbi:MAG: hypothetical protein ACO3A2_05965, partial [Bdellovibrionia bacterium]